MLMIILNVSAMNYSRIMVLVGFHILLHQGWRRQVTAMPLLLDYSFIFNVSCGLHLAIHNASLLATLTVRC